MNTTKSEKVRSIEKAPAAYQEYMEAERVWLDESISKTPSLLDVGCGKGRLLSFLKELTDTYTGIDLDSDAISSAKSMEDQDISFEVLDTQNLSKRFSENTFTTTVCLWNTIGNIEEDTEALSEMFKVTSGKAYISGIKKGMLEDRKAYYEAYDIDYELDEDKEIFYSKDWGMVRAYDVNDFSLMCASVGFTVVKVVNLGKIAFGVELSK